MVRKSRQQGSALRRTINIVPDVKNPRDMEIVQTRLQAAQMLTLADEKDVGGDPYNNTGQHATLGAIKKD